MKQLKGSNSTFNNAGSSIVKQVDVKTKVEDSHSLPMTGTANSVTQKEKDGKVVTERYYDENGNAYLDIDYTDHGNPKTHPDVPHQHEITFEDGKPKRGKDKKVE